MSLRSRLRAAARDESGFSLTELLVAMSIGVVVLFASMQIFINGVESTGRVTDRVEVTQKARLAMDRMVTLLNSQSCLDSDNPPVIAGSTATSISFYSDLTGGASAPARYDFVYDPAADTITERRSTATVGSDGSVTYGTATTRVIANEIQPVDASTPMFTYLKFKADGTIDPADATASGSVVGVPVSAANTINIVRVDVAFGAWSARTKRADRRAAVFTGTGLAPTADANIVSDGTNCA